jgi:hypothetical protein
MTRRQARPPNMNQTAHLPPDKCGDFAVYSMTTISFLLQYYNVGLLPC